MVTLLEGVLAAKISRTSTIEFQEFSRVIQDLCLFQDFPGSVEWTINQIRVHNFKYSTATVPEKQNETVPITTRYPDAFAGESWASLYLPLSITYRMQVETFGDVACRRRVDKVLLVGKYQHGNGH